MSLEEREGTLDRLLENGVLLGGERLNYSKWFEGERPSQEAVGRKVRVLLDIGEKCSFLKRVLAVGDKAIGWKPPGNPKGGPWQGGGRRLSPEELAMKRDEGVRIARSVAIDRATALVKEGISPEKVAALAKSIESYILTGVFAKEEKNSQDASLPSASETPPVAVPFPESRDKAPAATGKQATPAAAKPKRLPAKLVSGLFNEALRGGLVDDWQGFLEEAERFLKVQIKNPYQLDTVAFSKLESVIRAKLAHSSAA
jgi:hypothetical protein